MQETKEEEQKRIDRAYERFDQRAAARAQANEMLMQSGVLVVRSLLILNGAAAIALLAFLANVFTVDELDVDRARLMDAILRALANFAWGAFAAVFSMGASFFVNQSVVAGYDAEIRQFSPPHFVDGPKSKRWARAYVVYMIVAIASASASALVFAFGVTRIARAL